MPILHGDSLLIENYFLTFWGRTLGIGASSLSFRLSLFSEGDYGYEHRAGGVIIRTDDLADGLQCSRQELFSWIDTLEMYGFVLHLYAVPKSRPDETPLNYFKVRKSVPLLSRDLVDTLPPVLQKMHSDYIKEHMPVDFVLQDRWDYGAVKRKFIEGNTTL